MISFAYPWVLTLLVLIPLLYLYLLRFKRRPTVTVPSLRIFSRLGGRRYRLPTAEYFYLAAALVLIVALARPRLGDERVLIRAQGIDLILALDLSGSMAAIDVPRNITTVRELERGLTDGRVKDRLGVAKEELQKFVEGRPNDRIGLIGFGPLAYNVAPPTLDHAWLLAQLERLEPGIIGDATGIAAPLASGIHRLKSSPAPRRVLVLFTDGKNNVDNRITPQQVAELAKATDVIIHTVGVGSDNAVVAQNGRFYPTGDSFDEPLLREIAAKSGGTYFHAADAEGMHRVMQEINQLEKTTFEQPKYVEYREYAPLLAVLTLGLLLLGLVWESTLGLRLP